MVLSFEKDNFAHILFIINLNKMKAIYRILAIIAVPTTLLLYSYNTGSPGGKTGSMGDGGNTCTDCHSGTSQAQSGWITSNIPSEGYTAGETYLITATGTHSGVVKFGFELTAEDSFGSKSGTLSLAEPTRTKFTNANKAVTHTAAGNTPNGSSNTWTINWTAPDPAPTMVKFNAAFNAANGNGNNTGDQIYTSLTSYNLYIPPNPQIAMVEPNHEEQGFEGELSITGSETSWTSGVDEVRFVFSDNSNIFFMADLITVEQDELITVTVSIPIDIEIGNYDVHVDDLVLADGFMVDVVSGISDNYLADAVSLYPNPVIDNFIIDAPIGSNVVIADISGRIVDQYEITGSAMNINISSYNTGLYFVQITHNGNAVSEKLIKR